MNIENPMKSIKRKINNIMKPPNTISFATMYIVRKMNNYNRLDL